MNGKRIGVVMGGGNAEHEISLVTGEAVTKALAARGHQVVRVECDRDLDRAIRAANIDVAFIALHGTLGEDGCVQGLLEVLGIPYTGSGVLASALAMDKVKAKEMFRLHNVPTPPYYVLDATEISKVEDIHGTFGYPAFVKPRRQGSSVGASKAASPAELLAACEEAARFDRSLLIERFIRGREVAVAVFGERALGAIEIAPRGEFYDYRSKYQKGQSEYFLPPRLSAARNQGILRIAERACRSLGTVGAARVDLLVTEGENEYVLEVNTLPGMTPTSLLPKIAASQGHSFEDLCEAILAGASLDRDRSDKVARPSLPPPSIPAPAVAPGIAH